jgi:hypothetical protein
MFDADQNSWPALPSLNCLTIATLSGLTCAALSTLNCLTCAALPALNGFDWRCFACLCEKTRFVLEIQPIVQNYHAQIIPQKGWVGENKRVEMRARSATKLTWELFI